MFQIGIDTKNFALYSGGISHFFRPLLKAWIEKRTNCHFHLIGPPCNLEFLDGLPNYNIHTVPIFRNAPGPIKHALYDYIFAPMTIRSIRPDLFFSPYYDILVPPGIPFIVTIHDLCFTETADAFPFPLRQYYLLHLRRSIRFARKIITVSESSKRAIVRAYGVSDNRIAVVYNSFEHASGSRNSKNEDFKTTIEKFGLADSVAVLYPGGLEYRKNIDNLLASMELLSGKLDATVKLFITGDVDLKSKRRWKNLQDSHSFDIVYTGFLSRPELMAFYQSVDLVVYLSLCEGFGRVCLESMAAKTPLVCNDLEVFHEIAGDYPYYCDAARPSDILRGLTLALRKKKEPPPFPEKYRLETNTKRFLSAVQF